MYGQWRRERRSGRRVWGVSTSATGGDSSHHSAAVVSSASEQKGRLGLGFFVAPQNDGLRRPTDGHVGRRRRKWNGATAHRRKLFRFCEFYDIGRDRRIPSGFLTRFDGILVDFIGYFGDSLGFLRILGSFGIISGVSSWDAAGFDWILTNANDCWLMLMLHELISFRWRRPAGSILVHPDWVLSGSTCSSARVVTSQSKILAVREKSVKDRLILPHQIGSGILWWMRMSFERSWLLWSWQERVILTSSLNSSTRCCTDPRRSTVTWIPRGTKNLTSPSMTSARPWTFG